MYPPVVGSLFELLAHLDYFHAKLVWSVGQLICLIGGLALTAATVWPRRALLGMAVLLAAAAVFPPVLLEFERGQVDCLTFLLIVGAAWAWTVRGNSPLAAVLLIVAGLFKLPTLLLLLVPLAFRDVRFLRATVVALLAVVGLSLLLNGLSLTRCYWLHYLPAIAQERSDQSPQSSPDSVSPVVHWPDPASVGLPAPPPPVTWQGRHYLDRSDFPTRGSLVSSYLSPVPKRLRSLLSDFGYLAAVLIIVLGAYRARRWVEDEQTLMKTGAARSGDGRDPRLPHAQLADELRLAAFCGVGSVDGGLALVCATHNHCWLGRRNLAQFHLVRPAR